MSDKKGTVIRKPKSNKNYVNGPDFYLALVDHNNKIKKAKLENLPPPQISNYIGCCILHIANNLSKKNNFVGYSFKEEMVSDAIEKMIEAVDKFDVEYNKENPNPFAYFTQVSWNLFLQRIAKEKKEQYLKHKNFSKNYEDEFNKFQHEDKLNKFHYNDVAFNHEEHNRIIDDFERPKDKSSGYVQHKNMSYEPKE